MVINAAQHNHVTTYARSFALNYRSANRGYVAIDKQFVGRRPQTTCRLTPAGRDAFTRYLDHLEAIVRQGRTTPPRPGA